MALNQAGQDLIREKPVIARQHEWMHGDVQGCPRSPEPIFTNPNELPVCPNPSCPNDRWESKGYVLRDKKNGVIVHREGARK